MTPKGNVVDDSSVKIPPENKKAPIRRRGAFSVANRYGYSFLFLYIKLNYFELASTLYQ